MMKNILKISNYTDTENIIYSIIIIITHYLSSIITSSYKLSYYVCLSSNTFSISVHDSNYEYLYYTYNASNLSSYLYIYNNLIKDSLSSPYFLSLISSLIYLNESYSTSFSIKL